jgi:WD40 repeat protein/HEAT repeat protein
MLVISDLASSSPIGPHLPLSPALPPLPTPANNREFLIPLALVFLLAAGLVGTVLFLAMQQQEREQAETTTSQPEARTEGPPLAEKEEPTPREKAPDRPKKEEIPAAPAPPPLERRARPALSDLPWRGHVARILQLSFTDGGKVVRTASGGTVEKDGKETIAADSTLRRWDAATGKELERWPMTEKGISAAVFSPDGKLAAVSIASAATRGEVFVWDLNTRKQVHLLSGHTGRVHCLAFSPDSKQLLSGADDNLLLLWDVAKGRTLHELKGHTNAPNQVAFSPDGKLALSCGMDHSARLWDLDGGRQLRQFTGHADIVWAVAFLPNGQRALTGCGMQQIPGLGLVPGGRDYDIRLWDPSTGKEERRFSGHSSAVTALAFDRDGRRFLSGSHDGKIRFWQVETGKELRRYDGHDGRVRAIAFFPNGRRAISAGEDGRLRTWALPLDVSDLIADLGGAEAEARLRALDDLASRRDDARAAIPALFQALIRPDEKLRASVLQLLRDLSPLDKEHVLRLDRLLQDRSFPEGRTFALDALAALGADAAPAAKEMLGAVADKDVTIRRKAMKALLPVAGELGNDGFRPLIEALRDSDKDVRGGADAALAKLGTPPAEHLPALRGLLKEENEILRRYGLKALAGVGESARAAAADIVLRAKAETSPALRALAIAALTKIAPRDRTSVEVFTKALTDRDIAVNRHAARGLAASGSVPGLLHALGHDDAEVAKIAGEALDGVKYDPAHAPLLVVLLESKQESVRLRGIDALGKLAADGAEGVAPMSKLVKNAGPEERKRLLAAFGQMGPAARKAGSALVPLLKHKDLAVRFESCQTLIRIEAAEIGKAVSTLIDVLRPAKAEDVEDEDDKDREKARELLASIGKPAIKGLVDALQNEFARGGARTPAGVVNGVARLEVIKVLTAMGKEAHRNDVLIALAAMERNDPFPGVRKAAREARVKLQRKE